MNKSTPRGRPRRNCFRPGKHTDGEGSTGDQENKATLRATIHSHSLARPRHHNHTFPLGLTVTTVRRALRPPATAGTSRLTPGAACSPQTRHHGHGPHRDLLGLTLIVSPFPTSFICQASNDRGCCGLSRGTNWETLVHEEDEMNEHVHHTIHAMQHMAPLVNRILTSMASSRYSDAPLCLRSSIQVPPGAGFCR